MSEEAKLSSNASCIASALLWTVALGIAFIAQFFVFGTPLGDGLDRRVHEGLTRADIESYLGPPTGTMASTDEIPEMDRSRHDLPDHPAPGGIVSYRVRYEPEWMAQTPVGLHMRMWNAVFVYYDENEIALEVHVRNFS